MSGLELGDNLRDAALLVGFVLVTLIIFLVARLYDGASRPRRGRPWPPHWPSKSRQAYMFEQDRRREIAAADQLRAVMAAPFERKKLLSVSEYRVFRIIERELNAARRGHRIFAQTSLGEVLTSPNQNAFLSVNSKRTDMLIVDCYGWPVLAVEYQGSGHYQGTAVVRDTIKREALRKAGVGYLEVFEDDGDDEIRTRLRQHLARIWGNPVPVDTAPASTASQRGPWQQNRQQN